MRAYTRELLRGAGYAAMLTAALGATASAQLPNASPAAFAMAGNFTAIARGYEAVAWNPANLAMPGRPFMSLGAAAVGGTLGLDPVDFRALHDFSGKVVPDETKADWVEQARIAGGQKIRLDGGATYLGLSVGPIGLQAGSSFYNTMNLSPDAFEAVLFGNAGRTGGQPKDLDFTGTSVRAAAFTTGAASLAFGLPLKLLGGAVMNEKMAIGVTGKYVVGHGLIVAEDVGSAVGANDIQLRFPAIGVRTDETVSLTAPKYNGNAGSGMAADVALSWMAGPWRVGILAENVFNAFKWDTTMLAFMPGTGTFDGTNNSTDFDQQPYANAPAALREVVAGQSFAPAMSFGAALQLSRRLTLTADMKTHSGGDGTIVIGPRSRFGVGAELKLIPLIPIRAGVSSVSDGWQAGVGAGLRLLGYELGAATSIRRRGAATESGLMVGVIGLGR